MKLDNHNGLTTFLTARNNGTAINKLELYAAFRTPVAITYFNEVEKTKETAAAGTWVTIGHKGQAQPQLFPDGRSSFETIYAATAPMTFDQARAFMVDKIGQDDKKLGKLIVSPDAVQKGLASIKDSNPDFDPSKVEVAWFYATRRYLAFRVEVPVEINKAENWGAGATSCAAPDSGIVVVNPGIETYALQLVADLPGWYVINEGIEVRGKDLFDHCPLLTESDLAEFV